MFRNRSLNWLGASKIYRVLLSLALMALALLQPRVTQAHSNAQMMGEPGTVYVLTNQLSGNGVAVFTRGEDGALSEPTIVPTGGQGISSGLGSQGAIALSPDGKWLLAVNAGSDEVSVLAIAEDGSLELVSKVDSGGVRPNSIAIHKDLVYVLNAGASGNITGFHLSADGELMPIAGSTRHVSNLGLGDAPLPAQVSFDPKGQVLVVTERASNMIDIFQVGKDGIAYGPTAQMSAGMTPYGFAFTPKGTLVVSEAFGGAENGSAVSSYTVAKDNFVVDSQSVSTTQTAACWVAVSLDGKYAYSANAGSSSISAYSVAADGSLTLLDGAAGMTGDGTAPVDMGMSADGQYLYVLSAKSQSVIGFAVQMDGSLESLGDFTGLPKGSGGIAVR